MDFWYEVVLLFFGRRGDVNHAAASCAVGNGSDMTVEAIETARTKDGGRPRGRPPPASDDRRRAEIVEIGRLVFLDLGYGRATMGEVAARARISKQTLYRFFLGKAALFAAVVEAHRHAMLDFSTALDRLPVAEALKAIFRVDIDAEADRARHALLEMAFHESVSHPELRDVILRHGVERSRRDLARWLEQRARLEPLAVDDPDLLAGFLMDMVFGASRPPPPPGEVEPLERRRRRIEGCVALFLDGVRPRPPGP